MVVGAETTFLATTDELFIIRALAERENVFENACRQFYEAGFLRLLIWNL
jgi:hypothetical protein